MKNAFKICIVASGALLVAGCATVVSGTQQSVFVDTPYVTDAECKLNDSKSGVWYLKETPGSVSVLKGNGPLNVVCSKKGYETATVSVDDEFAGATLGNVILGGGIGVLVDAASGAAQKYPDKIVVWMKPRSFSSASARKQWEQEKKAHEERVAQELEARRKQQVRNNN